MTTRLKTVEFAHPPYAGVMTDNSLTTMPQITVYLPESGITFRSVVATVSTGVTGTAAGNVTTRQLQCRLGAAGYTTATQSNLYTGSGEDIFQFHGVNLTAHFTSNWSGTSMTFDSQVLMDGTQTAAGWTNVCVTLSITYEYDDTSSTQIKTVRIPLDAPVGALATSKPGSPTTTIPALDTELPEASKVYRNIYTTIQGNIALAGSTTDQTITQQLVTTTAQTSGIFEAVSASDYWFRYIWSCGGNGGTNVIVTNTTQAYYIYGNAAKVNHLQAWLVVTYEFDATSSNNVFVSVILPQEVASPMGGSTSSDYQRASRELRISEPGSITTKQVAFYAFWDQIAAISTLQFRVGTGSFVTYTDTAAAMCGNNGAMVRNDAAFTLARGKNTLQADVYRSDTADLGFALSGFWIVNYTASKPSQGYGAANHTVAWNLGALYDGAASVDKTLTAIAPIIPETTYYMTAVGARYEYISNSTGQPGGQIVLVERLAAEGGVAWEAANIDTTMTDPETGLRTSWCQIKDDFLRWPGDPGADRMDIETARRWRVVLGNACTGFHRLDLFFTYHTITYAVAGNVSGSAGGTVNLALHRDGTGEKVLSTTRSGNGSYSFTWYDNVDNMFVQAREDATHLGRSDSGPAA